MQLSDLQSERKVLAEMVHSEEACIEALSRLQTDDFSEQLHKDIFNLITAIYTDGAYPNYTVFLKEAHKLGFIDNNKKLKDIHGILSDWQGVSEIGYWVENIISAKKARDYFSILKKHEAMLSEQGVKDIDRQIDSLVGETAGIDLNRIGSDIDDAESIASSLLKSIEERVKRFEQIKLTGDIVLEGVSTGITGLDKLTLGYKPGDLIVVGAQTGHGKTAFALQTAKNIAIDGQKPILYINTEMTREVIYQRLAGIVSGVPLYKIRQGNLEQLEYGQVKRAIQVIGKSGFYHSYAPHLTAARCVVLGKKARIQKKVDMIVVDYIGRMEKYDPGQQEWQVLEQITKSMKLLAQELQIPIMVLAQLNEDGSLQGAKRIKNECDLLLKLSPLSRAEVEEKYSKKYVDANYRLYVDKNRDGEADKNIALNYEKTAQQIRPAKIKREYQEWAELGTVIGEDV